MLGYCEQCGAAIYTPADVGEDESTMESITIGVIPYVLGSEIERVHLVCKGCMEEVERQCEAFIESDEFKIECEIEKAMREGI
jgi:hypothetical protein